VAGRCEYSHLPPYGIVRWLSANADSNTLTFGPEHELRKPHNSHLEERVDDRYDLLEIYPEESSGSSPLTRSFGSRKAAGGSGINPQRLYSA
jgi:hypothetical protein